MLLVQKIIIGFKQPVLCGEKIFLAIKILLSNLSIQLQYNLTLKKIKICFIVKKSVRNILSLVSHSTISSLVVIMSGRYTTANLTV